MAAVLMNHNRNIAIELARSPTHITLLHQQEGPFKIENFLLTRDFLASWKPFEKAVEVVAKAWLYHPLGIALRGTDEALAAIQDLAHGREVGSTKVEKIEKQAARAEQPSSKAREILRKFDLTDKKQSKPFYDACEAAGIDRKLAASVLCIERKKLNAAPKTRRIVVKKAKKKGKR